MIASQKIFIDSSFFVSFIDRADLNYQKSIAIMDFLAVNNFSVYTSDLVVIQVFSRVQRDLGSTVGIEFLEAILDSGINIIYPSDSSFISVKKYLASNRGKQVSLTELINSYLMDKASVSSVLTYDFWSNLFGTRISQLVNN